MILHYFNPGYEASARDGLRHYTPPRPVRQLRHDLATLPLYYAAADERVLVPEDLPEPLRTPACVTEVKPGDRLLPWGLAPEVPGLPYPKETMRRWTSRQQSVDLWRQIYDETLFGPLTPPLRVTAAEELPTEGRWVAKLDFSSSGRGIFFLPRSSEPLRRTLMEMLRRHRELFLEPWLDKVEDRGYEFVRQSDGRIDYLGANRFTTDRGRYGSAIVTPQAVVDRTMEQQATRPSHHTYIARLLEVLPQLDFGGYVGPFGIDTVVFLDGDGSHRLAPLVEVNLRRTMGHVVLALAEQWLPAGSPPLLLSITAPTGVPAAPPLYLSHTLVPDGPTPLTPILPETRFAALLTPAELSVGK